MLLPASGIHQDIINKHNDTNVKQLMKYLVHQTHEGCRSIGQAKGHHHKLIMTISGPECCLGDILPSDPQLMVTRSEVNLGKDDSTLKLIKQIIYPRQWIIIPDSYFIQLPKINT